MKIVTLYEAVQLLLDLVPDKDERSGAALHEKLVEVCAEGEELANRVARLLAQELGVDVYESSWESEEEGGLAFACVPKVNGAPVPDELLYIDAGADWEVPERPVFVKKLEPIGDVLCQGAKET